ncbi:MAG: 23S rRNA (pseudouridine(1915)-N(3))-methyltransferase RlmH [Syntrophomonadaceae bacterium]|nr:23S rRNA (pseudouridine(1915)-N(3))-methyltransferase RlmH [Syntrophomonadaceae bacterium]
MKYRIISVGKIREPFYLQGANEYLKRLKPYTAIGLTDGWEEKISPNAGPKDIEKCLLKEGERVLSRLGDNELLVAFDPIGQMMTSEEFARQIEEWNHSGRNRVNLLVGGAHGLHAKVKNAAGCLISFSPMTLPHQMAVLILTEQIYRGFKILRGEPYHK